MKRRWARRLAIGAALRKEALGRTEIEQPPGRRWPYNNYNPLLLGLLLERATGQSVSDYMAGALWRTLGWLALFRDIADRVGASNPS